MVSEAKLVVQRLKVIFINGPLTELSEQKANFLCHCTCNLAQGLISKVLYF